LCQMKAMVNEAFHSHASFLQFCCLGMFLEMSMQVQKTNSIIESSSANVNVDGLSWLSQATTMFFSIHQMFFKVCCVLFSLIFAQDHQLNPQKALSIRIGNLFSSRCRWNSVFSLKLLARVSQNVQHSLMSQFFFPTFRHNSLVFNHCLLWMHGLNNSSQQDFVWQMTTGTNKISVNMFLLQKCSNSNLTKVQFFKCCFQNKSPNGDARNIRGAQLCWWKKVTQNHVVTWAQPRHTWTTHELLTLWCHTFFQNTCHCNFKRLVTLKKHWCECTQVCFQKWLQMNTIHPTQSAHMHMFLICSHMICCLQSFSPVVVMKRWKQTVDLLKPFTVCQMPWTLSNASDFVWCILDFIWTCWVGLNALCEISLLVLKVKMVSWCKCEKHQHGFDWDPSELFRPIRPIQTHSDLVLRPIGSDWIFI